MNMVEFRNLEILDTFFKMNTGVRFHMFINNSVS